MSELRSPLRVTAWTRLYFAWAMLWAALATIVLASGMLLHSLIKPSPATFKRWLTWWGKGILAGAGFRLRTEVRSPIPEEVPVVFVANHQNMMDIVTCAAGIPHSYGFAAKEPLRKTPFIGKVLERSPSVFVDRSTPRRAAESVIEAARLIRGGNSVLVYAEGERTYGDRLLPFLRGAFLLAAEAGVPIVPVVIMDNYQVIDERRWAARPGPVHMLIGEPIPTRNRSRGEIPVLMEEAREVMQRELDRFHGRPAEAAGVSLASAQASRP